MLPEIGVYYQNQPSSEAPAYSVSLNEARQLKTERRAYFINHGKAIRLRAVLEPEDDTKLRGGSMADAWHVKESGIRSEVAHLLKERFLRGITVLQMRRLPEAKSREALTIA